ncbi:MAG: GcrA cell cycle regulator [Acidobacteria bacterium]|nr:GcrA cell cycle regulator [Acidobacteriota bacterium]
MTSTSWSDERIARLKQLWTDGLSAREIATRLGGVTRNAVLGKLDRLGLLGGRARVTPTAKSPRRERRRAPIARTRPRTPAPAAPASVAPDWPGEVAWLEQLQSHHCRWPIGDPLKAGFSFCGRRRARGPYCSEHGEVAYGPAQAASPRSADVGIDRPGL